MSDDRETRVLKIVLFMFLMLLIVEMSPVASALFSGSLFDLIATGVFFLTFVLMYSITAGFVKWDGGRSISELGMEWEDSTVVHIIIGAIAGSAASLLVVSIASVLGGQLRPLDQITGDLIAAEILITAPTAVFEELVHRGYILTHLETLIGRPQAIIIGSCFFSFLHFSWWMEPGVTPALILIFSFNMFLGGVVLSISYYLSGRRLWIPIAFHFMWNMFAYLLFPSFPRDSVTAPWLFQIEWGLTTILAFLFGLSLIWSLYMSLGRNKN
ncbi:MAG: lysostaphin resistance A-like protein [Candidatus Thorarchaeota archaeon]|nr:MAG: hypothetical protein DRO87_09425 [Candidatus Thorarchaeota archaeon]RLI57806.1 MAG: hypothetical protein DRP09_01850 [Candidatus Thorarchaeota archaeon]